MKFSDEELTTYLRWQGLPKDFAAADRIEQLVKGNKGLADAFAIVSVKREMAEGKLDKAVEALRYYAVEALPWDADDSLVARKVLAELDQQKDTNATA